MKNFAKHPFISGFIIFFLVLFCGTLAGFIFGIFVAANGNCQPSPSNPCDGSAMAAGIIWILSFWASLIFGVFAGITTSIILKIRNDRQKQLN